MAPYRRNAFSLYLCLTTACFSSCTANKRIITRDPTARLHRCRPSPQPFCELLRGAIIVAHHTAQRQIVRRESRSHRSRSKEAVKDILTKIGGHASFWRAFLEGAVTQVCCSTHALTHTKIKTHTRSRHTTFDRRVRHHVQPAVLCTIIRGAAATVFPHSGPPLRWHLS